MVNDLRYGWRNSNDEVLRLETVSFMKKNSVTFCAILTMVRFISDQFYGHQNPLNDNFASRGDEFGLSETPSTN